jgi:hypothetical protein
MEPNEQAVASAVEGQDGGQQAVVEPQPTTEQGTVADPWESEQNPYRAKYTGIQGTFGQVKTERDQLKAINEELQSQVQAMGEFLASLQQEPAGVTSEQLNQGIGQLRQRQQAQKALSQLAEAERQRNELVKPFVIRAIAEQHGVNPADIEDAPSPEVAEYLAKKLAVSKRTATLESRRAERTDAAESSGGGSSPNLDRLTAREKIRLGVERMNRSSA